MTAAWILLIGGACLLAQSRRQYALDRRLIAALVKNNALEARDMVVDGANPNTPYEPPAQPALLPLWDHLFHRTTPPVNTNPTAFLMASGAYWHADGLTSSGPTPIDAPQVVETMLRHGAKVNMRGEIGLTPLHWAVRSNHQRTVDVLISHGADVNAKADNGTTPLMYVSDGHTSIVRMLIEHGANVNARDDDGLTPMSSSLPNVRPDSLRLLIDKGADVNTRDKDGETPLMKASKYNSSPTAVVRMLIEHGAQIDARDKDGDTALISAARNADPAVVRLLIEHGADINATDKDGYTPLTAAVANADSTVLHLLLEHGAEVNVRNKSGDTALIEAVDKWYSNDEAIRLLLAHGADPNVRNTGGMTVLQLARKNKYTVADMLLRRAGAKK
ncbi:MAG: ankyrin repeat protein [Chthonomonadaceae bacterium]|nr:ankyrin repeat protein [Chthonomonadaceae bacterium]